jgi:hypothetical protein
MAVGAFLATGEERKEKKGGKKEKKKRGEKEKKKLRCLCSC